MKINVRTGKLPGSRELRVDARHATVQYSRVRRALTTTLPVKAHKVIPGTHSLSSLLPIKRHRPLILSLVNVGVFSCKLSATTADLFSTDQDHMTVDILPDEALLEIFSFYLAEASDHIEPWLPIVHVCRRWRSIIFESPRRLDVRVLYTPKRQVKVMLDTWPNLPIHILCATADGYKAWRWHGENNLIAALEHTDRICQIQLDGPGSQLEGILLAMRKPFPALTGLDISSSDDTDLEAMAGLPEAFLGGCAQHLRSCKLWEVEFPGIWKLLLTANHLVTLILWNIPHSMYASPEEMVTYLSTMPNLESLSIGFRSPQSLHNWRDQLNRLLSPLTRVVLPSLTNFEFQVESEYIEDFITRIDVPLLDNVDITFFDQPIFDTPRLRDFLAPFQQFKAHSRGGVVFWDSSSSIEFELEPGSLSLGVLSEGSGREVSSMAQLCGSSLHLPSALKRLDIREGSPQVLGRRGEVENTRWLDLLRPFTGLKDLHLGKRLALHYALALQELSGERVTELLPALQNLFIQGLRSSGPTWEALGLFAAARQLSGLPVAVHSWDGQS